MTGHNWKRPGYPNRKRRSSLNPDTLSPVEHSKKLKNKDAANNAASPLTDYIRPGLNLVFVGINPGTQSARHGRHYAGPNNAFWPLLYESRLVTEPLTFAEDERVLEWNIGLTNIVERSTPSSQDLSRSEVTHGASILRKKLLQCQPRFVCFNGKGIFESFIGRKCEFGLQSAPLAGTDTRIYVMPSTSGRTSSHPTRASKLPYFVELCKLVNDSCKRAAGE